MCGTDRLAGARVQRGAPVAACASSSTFAAVVLQIGRAHSGHRGYGRSPDPRATPDHVRLRHLAGVVATSAVYAASRGCRVSPRDIVLHHASAAGRLSLSRGVSETNDQNAHAQREEGAQGTAPVGATQVYPSHSGQGPRGPARVPTTRRFFGLGNDRRECCLAL